MLGFPMVIADCAVSKTSANILNFEPFLNLVNLVTYCHIVVCLKFWYIWRNLLGKIFEEGKFDVVTNV